MAANSEREPLINDNLQLQSYYNSLEPRIGYKLFLSGTRHFGYYEHDTYWPSPVNRALRAMEDKMAASLGLTSGAYVLDAGCGAGHVAIHLAKRYGYRVLALDVVDHHVVKARRNIVRSGLAEGQVEARKMDYHHLETLKDESLDGVYTMETLVHATDPEAVLAGFYRLLRPGGRISLFEYEHKFLKDSSETMASYMRKVNEIAAMPTNARSHPGVIRAMVEDAGYTDVVVRDYTENIKPLTRLFYLVAYVPFLIITFLRLERYFINTMAGVGAYGGREHWRYVTISGTKPRG